MSFGNIMYKRVPYSSGFFDHPVEGGGQDGVNSIATPNGLEGLAFESWCSRYFPYIPDGPQPAVRRLS